VKLNKPSQVGGIHYADMAIGPIYFCLANNMGPCETKIVHYISRWRGKGGIDDLRKAKDYIEILIDWELDGQND